MTEFNEIEKAKHYNSHPSGIECGTISWQMTAALCQAFQYGWRYHEKEDPVKDLRKMLFYIRYEITNPMVLLVDQPLYRQHFRSVMEDRWRALIPPSPWCNDVLLAMTAICTYHIRDSKLERMISLEIAERRILDAIDGLSGMSHAEAPAIT